MSKLDAVHKQEMSTMDLVAVFMVLESRIIMNEAVELLQFLVSRFRLKQHNWRKKTNIVDTYYLCS